MICYHFKVLQTIEIDMIFCYAKMHCQTLHFYLCKFGIGPRMSIATWYQGIASVGVICIGSGGLLIPTAWQELHFSISSLIFWFIFGYQIFSRNRHFVFSMPWWTIWASCVAFSCKLSGIMILLFFNRTSFSLLLVISSEHRLYGWISLSCISHCPVSKTCMTFVSLCLFLLRV